MKNEISKPNVYSLEKIEKLRLETLRNIETLKKKTLYLLIFIFIVLDILSIYFMYLNLKLEHLYFGYITFAVLISGFLYIKSNLTLFIAFLANIGTAYVLLNFFKFEFYPVIFIVMSPFSVFLFYTIIAKSIVKSKEKLFKFIFKQNFIKPHIRNLGYNYDSNRSITDNEIKFSRLYGDNFIKQGGNDRISGQKDGVDFVFSDINISVNNNGYFPSNGIFFYADFNKFIASNTLIFSTDFIPFQLDRKLIKMDNVEFNKIFKVFTDKPKNAAYLLSPLLMQQLLELHKIFKCPINISFRRTKICIAILRDFDSFEPDINQSVLTHNPIHYIEQDLNKIFEIIETLRLNRKIWSVEK
ncbi:MAG: DUF3137 domain-containing protein [Campylobacter sp.]|nr:DUF3137 domain-containing protein [Campylobacter sp.]